MRKLPGLQKWVSIISGGIGLACLIVGIVGDTMNCAPGLEPIHWFLLGIALIVNNGVLTIVALGMAWLKE